MTFQIFPYYSWLRERFAWSPHSHSHDHILFSLHLDMSLFLALLLLLKGHVGTKICLYCYLSLNSVFRDRYTLLKAIGTLAIRQKKFRTNSFCSSVDWCLVYPSWIYLKCSHVFCNPNFKAFFFFFFLVVWFLNAFGKLEKVEGTIGDKEEEEKINPSPNLNLTRKHCRPKKLILQDKAGNYFSAFLLLIYT